MGQPSNLGSLLMADESAFGEAVNTFDERLPVTSAVDLSGLTQEMMPVDPVHQYQNSGVHMMRGQQAGSITIEMYLCGHGTATTGAITATSIEKFVGNVIGAYSDSSDGGTIAAFTNSNQFTETDATFANGSLLRVGTLGDGRGDGQYIAVKDGTTMLMHTALGASPDVGDVLYAPVLLYPNEGPTTGTTPMSYRFCIQTANQQYRLHGCFPTGIAFGGLSPGEIPTVSVTMGVSRWAVHPHSSETFPTATAVTSHVPSPVAGGSFFFQTFDSDTRATYTIREFSLTIDFGSVELRGPGAADGHQVIVGARRTRTQASFEFVIDSETSGTTTFDSLWNTAEGSQSYKHCLYTLSAGRDGATVGFYFPKCSIVGQRPTQFDMDGINRQRISMRAVTSETKTLALEKANFILGMG